MAMLDPQLLTKIKVACMHHVALMKDGACGSVRTLDGEHAYFSMEATQYVRLVAFDLSTGKGQGQLRSFGRGTRRALVRELCKRNHV